MMTLTTAAGTALAFIVIALILLAIKYSSPEKYVSIQLLFYKQTLKETDKGMFLNAFADFEIKNVSRFFVGIRLVSLRIELLENMLLNPISVKYKVNIVMSPRGTVRITANFSDLLSDKQCSTFNNSLNVSRIFLFSEDNDPNIPADGINKTICKFDVSETGGQMPEEFEKVKDIVVKYYKMPEEVLFSDLIKDIIAKIIK